MRFTERKRDKLLISTAVGSHVAVRKDVSLDDPFVVQEYVPTFAAYLRCVVGLILELSFDDESS